MVNGSSTDDAISSVEYHPRDFQRPNDLEMDLGASGGSEVNPSWAMTVPDAVTPCQSFDLCIDLKCGTCYDPYLGAHVSCGKMTYYDCQMNLPVECRPLKCTDTNIRELKVS